MAMEKQGMKDMTLDEMKGKLSGLITDGNKPLFEERMAQVRGFIRVTMELGERTEGVNNAAILRLALNNYMWDRLVMAMRGDDTAYVAKIHLYLADMNRKGTQAEKEAVSGGLKTILGTTEKENEGGWSRKGLDTLASAGELALVTGDVTLVEPLKYAAILCNVDRKKRGKAFETACKLERVADILDEERNILDATKKEEESRGRQFRERMDRDG